MNEIFLNIVKYAFTLYLIILIPIYWRHYGAQNFLWISDVGLLLTLIALWFRSSLLISMAIIVILPFEIFWIIDFIYHFYTGNNLLGVVGYMFNPKNPLLIRGLSFFHIVVPIIWIWCLFSWGYNSKALFPAVLLIVAVAIATYFLTNPAANINWVFTPLLYNWKVIPSYAWLVMLIIVYPLIVIVPMHFFLKWIY